MAGDLNFKFRAGMDNSEALVKFRQLKDELTSLRDSIKNAASEVKIKVSVDSASLAQDVTWIKTTIRNQIEQVDIDVSVKPDSASIASSATAIKNCYWPDCCRLKYKRQYSSCSHSARLLVAQHS